MNNSEKEKILLDNVVVASGNPGKVERYGRLLRTIAKEVIGLETFSSINKPEETGMTAEENAEIKASFYAKKTGIPAFSIDESLFVDFLPEDKQPGVFVRRIDGKDDATDEELLSYWENIIKDVPEAERTGNWHIAYCLAYPDGKCTIVAKDHPLVFFYPSSNIKIPGWPMSSLEGPARFNKPHSELTSEERQVHEKETDLIIIEAIESIGKKL